MKENKNKMLKSIFGDIKNFADSHSYTYDKCSDKRFMNNYVDKYYRDFNDILEEIKLSLNIALKECRFYLEYMHCYYTSCSLIFINGKKEEGDVIKNAVIKWLDIIISNSLSQKTTRLYIDGFLKYIKEQSIIDLINENGSVYEFVDSLSWCLQNLCVTINSVINLFEELYNYVKCDNDNINKKNIKELYVTFFTTLNEDIRIIKCSMEQNIQVKNNLDDKDECNQIINYYEQQLYEN